MRRLSFLLAVIGILSSCSSTKVTSDQARNANFSSFRTFEMVYQSELDDVQVNGLNAQRVESAIRYEGRVRGLEPAEDAELLIVWGLGVEPQRNYTTSTNYYATGNYGRRGRVGGYGMATSQSDSQEYITNNGTLRITVIDKVTEEVIWIGIAQDELKGKTKDAEKKINKIIEKVFKDFPIEKYRS